MGRDVCVLGTVEKGLVWSLDLWSTANLQPVAHLWTCDAVLIERLAMREPKTGGGMSRVSYCRSRGAGIQKVATQASAVVN